MTPRDATEWWVSPGNCFPSNGMASLGLSSRCKQDLWQRCDIKVMLPSCNAATPLPWSSPLPLLLPLPFAGGRVTTQGCSSCNPPTERHPWSRRHSAPPMGPHCIIEVSNGIRCNFVPNGHGRHVHKKDKVSASASASHMGYACSHAHSRNTLTHTLTHTHTHSHTHSRTQTTQTARPLGQVFLREAVSFLKWRVAMHGARLSHDWRSFLKTPHQQFIIRAYVVILTSARSPVHLQDMIVHLGRVWCRSLPAYKLLHQVDQSKDPLAILCKSMESRA